MFKTREEEPINSESSAGHKKDGLRQGIEEKNKFALSVLRRVRVKLEGREPDSLRKVIFIRNFLY